MPTTHGSFRIALRARSLAWPLRWGGSASFVLIAFGLRYALLGRSPFLPFLLFFPAIALATLLFGRGCGYVAVALSAALAIYFLMEPRFDFALPTATDTVGVGLFLLAGLFVVGAIEVAHAAYADAERSRQDAAAALKRAEAELHARDLLLIEFAHRTKNDMQQITATLLMQAAGAAPEAAGALREAANRVRVLARLHNRLARRDGHLLVDMRDFLQGLVADLRTGMADLRPIGLPVEAERRMLSLSRAGAVGLIVNELVTNALKHAFPDEREGAIRIGFRRDGGDFVLTVADDGVGLPPVLADAPPARGGMGRRLVRALAAQLGGRIETSRREPSGTLHTLRFPVEPPDDGHRAIDDTA